MLVNKKHMILRWSIHIILRVLIFSAAIMFCSFITFLYKNDIFGYKLFLLILHIAHKHDIFNESHSTDLHTFFKSILWKATLVGKKFYSRFTIYYFEKHYLWLCHVFSGILYIGTGERLAAASTFAMRALYFLHPTNPTITIVAVVLLSKSMPLGVRRLL